MDQYEAIIEESRPSVLDLEASTSRVKGKGVGCLMRNKDEAKSSVASALSAPIALMGEGKRKN